MPIYQRSLPRVLAIQCVDKVIKISATIPCFRKLMAKI